MIDPTIQNGRRATKLPAAADLHPRRASCRLSRHHHSHKVTKTDIVNMIQPSNDIVNDLKEKGKF